VPRYLPIVEPQQGGGEDRRTMEQRRTLSPGNYRKSWQRKAFARLTLNKGLPIFGEV
jgi:hypothetical protein